MTTATETVELYSTTIGHEMPLESALEDEIEFIEFIDFFDSIEEAAEWAASNGCGWYLWSTLEAWKYLGAICVSRDRGPGFREF